MTQRCRLFQKAVFLVALLPLIFTSPARASHETIVIDGNLADLITAVNNNLGSSNGGFTAASPLGNIYSPSCSFVNGFDIRNVYALFDFKEPGGAISTSVDLYLGWQVEGVIGDVDGDGNPDTFTQFNAMCANNGDQAGIGTAEAYNFFGDAGCDFTPDLQIVVSNNTVTVNGGPAPGATLARNGSFLEVHIPNLQDYSGADLCGLRFFMTANATFDGLGEDASPQFTFAVPPSITVTKTEPVQTSCAGAPVSWTITVTNDGLCTLNQVSVRDTLDAGLSFVSSNPAPAGGSGQERNWTFTDLAPGASQVITLTANMPETCAGTLLNRVTAEGVIEGACRVEGVESTTASAVAEVICRETPCDISGDLATCVGNTETYTTTVGAPFSRQWSVTSTPPGICTTVGGTTGISLQVQYTAAGVCTVSLTVTDPINPNVCVEVCTQLVTVNPEPPCDILGDFHVCDGNDPETYTTTVGAEYTRNWSATSNPPGICSFVGGTTGGSVQIQFTGAGTCTLTLAVEDPDDVEDCGTTCTQVITIDEPPPCDISGATAVCLGTGASEVYTTTVLSPPYTRAWSATSSPGGICNISGPTDGSSVTLNFTGAGQCTLRLTVTDPGDPEDCGTVCEQIITISNTPACDITGDLHVCVGNDPETYSTTVGSEFNRTWSATSTPDDICSIVGGNTGGSVQIQFTGAGQCTISLTVTDPNNVNCTTTCSTVVTIDEVPPCDISGPETACIGETSVFSATGNGLTFAWSATSSPAGICSIDGPTDGSQVSVSFTGAGTCTLSLSVSDSDDPDDCYSSCMTIITISDCAEPELCWMTGGGCLNEPVRKGQKDHTFGGNVGPPPSGSWEHVVRYHGKILFNFHSWDAAVDSCWHDSGDGPCHPEAEANNITWSGTGKYSEGSGGREVDATFTAHVEDRGEPGNHDGPCGSTDFYEITVFNLDGSVAFHAEGYLQCGNLQIHPLNGPHTNDPVNDGTRRNELGTTDEKVGVDAFAPNVAIPNPFRGATTIQYAVTGNGDQDVEIAVYDVTGRNVRNLLSGTKAPGRYETSWDGRSNDGVRLPGGIYFVRSVVGQDVRTMRLVLLK